MSDAKVFDKHDSLEDLYIESAKIGGIHVLSDLGEIWTRFVSGPPCGRVPAPAKRFASLWVPNMGQAATIAKLCRDRAAKGGFQASGAWLEFSPESGAALIESAGRSIGAVVKTDAEIRALIAPVLKKLEDEFERLKASGQMKVINQGYRQARHAQKQEDGSSRFPTYQAYLHALRKKAVAEQAEREGARLLMGDGPQLVGGAVAPLQAAKRGR